MIEKLEKVLDLAAEALSLYIRKTQAELGEALPMGHNDDKERETAQAAKKPRKPKAEKPPLAQDETLKNAAPPAASVFGTQPAPAAPEKPGVEEQLEAKRRCTEVMGLFIRRFMNSNPKGLDRAKKILNDTTGRAINKLEDLTYEDHVKLIPVFEKELEAAAVAA